MSRTSARTHTPGPQQERKYTRQLFDSFPFFLKEIWRLCPKVLPAPHWIQYDMANWLQNGPSRRGVRGKRGLSKTWITCAYVLWRLFRNHLEKILLCSATPGLSKKSLLMMRVWINYIPFLRHLTPKPVKPWRDSAEMFDVGPCMPEHAPSVSAMGILSPLPGTRATLIVPDDVETPENTLTKASRSLLAYRTEQFEDIVLEGGEIVYLGTDQNEESVYEKLENRGYGFRAWPVAYPASIQEVPGLAPSLVQRMESGQAKTGDPVWPERWNKEWIENRRMLGVQTFAMQQMLRRGFADEELYPLKLANFMVYPLHRDKAPSTLAWGKQHARGSTALEGIPSPGFGDDQFYGPAMIDDEWLPYGGTKTYLDPAGSGKDEMAWATIGQLHGLLFGKDVGGVHGGPTEDNLERIVSQLRTPGSTELVIETNFGGEFLIPLIRPVINRFTVSKPTSQYPRGWSCLVRGEHSSGMKEARVIDRIEPPLNQHRIILSPEVAQDTTFTYQLTRIRRERGCLEHDDRVEAFSGACWLWMDYMDQDFDAMAQAKQQEAYEEMLREYKEYAAPQEPNWLKHRR